MATVTLNAALTSISGTIGRMVFYHRNGRVIARRWVMPPNPDTPAQRKNRSRFKEAMSAWKALTDDEKAAYTKKARGSGMTGHNLFISGWMKNRTQETDIKPVMETAQGYTLGIHCDDETYCRRVSRYAPTNKSSSRLLHPSVTAPSCPHYRVNPAPVRDLLEVNSP
ncbi:MAG TPA: hypothetical protein PK926_03675 [Spirochaetota bacterium]|nr:hypothetical protein [Spirochaetota bacterium]HPI91202.1 hypothetical protein [Spirochaetota bacterium]HPR47087.1 hypothetical protein [Spirochaetota bacterium]